MSFHCKSEKEFNALKKNATRVKVDSEIPDGYKMIERLEKKLVKLQKAFNQDHILLIKKCEEIEGLKNIERNKRLNLS